MYTGFTIDSLSTVDRDDAIWFAEEGENVRLRVYVANLASLLKRDTKTDLEAKRLLETQYRPRAPIWMLPKPLQDAASLEEGQPRKVMGVEVLLHQKTLAFVQDPELFLGEFQSEKALTYKEIPGILQESKHPWHSSIKFLATLSQRLLAQRREKGALALYDLNYGWVTNEEGYLVKQAREDTLGYVVIQELMIMANAAIAEFAAKNEIPILFRNHTAKAHVGSHSIMLEQLAVAIADPSTLDTVRQRLHLLMNRATYNAELIGHYGLNLPAYSHTTSPIRRYADLITQRQLVAYLQDQRLPYTRLAIMELGQNITEILQSRKEAVSERYRGWANDKAEQRIDKALMLKKVSSKDFERVLKVLIEKKQPPNDAIIEAFDYRLLRGSATSLDMALLLFKTPSENPDWQRMCQAALSYLVKNPHLAPSIAGIAHNTVGLEELRFKSRREGSDHRAAFFSIATSSWQGEACKGPEVAASNSKLSKQRAIIALFAFIRGLESPQWEIPKIEAPKPKAKIPAPLSSNPVAALQEWCQARNILLPEYHYGRSGDDHTPTFVCVCSANNQEGKGEAGAKKKAKLLAAKALLEQL